MKISRNGIHSCLNSISKIFGTLILTSLCIIMYGCAPTSVVESPDGAPVDVVSVTDQSFEELPKINESTEESVKVDDVQEQVQSELSTETEPVIPTDTAWDLVLAAQTQPFNP